MSDCASGASFFGSGGADRIRARLFPTKGAGFKLNCTTADVESAGFDQAGTPAPNNPRPARLIVMTTGTQIEADLAHGASWEETRMRARCGDDSWSNWVVVRK